jgi:hypothetical protein
MCPTQIGEKEVIMQDKSLVFEDVFWKILVSLEGLQEARPMKDFLRELDCTHDKFLGVCSFLENLSLKVNTSEQDGHCFIHPFEKAESVHLELTMSEWLALQAHYPKMNEIQESSFHNIWQDCAQRVEQDYPQFSLSKAKREEGQLHQALGQLRLRHKDLISTIESTLNDHSLLEIKLQDEKVFDLYTHKIVYLDGSLSLVGEDCTDRCLVYFNIDEVADLKKIGISDYRPNFATVEVHDFIFAIRAVSGNEERLVLKIINQDGVDLNPSYHFLGNPYITANVEGEMIWAASVEVSDSLYEWLFEMRGQVEILDPPELKDDFEVYAASMSPHLKKAS